MLPRFLAIQGGDRGSQILSVPGSMFLGKSLTSLSLKVVSKGG